MTTDHVTLSLRLTNILIGQHIVRLTSSHGDSYVTLWPIKLINNVSVTRILNNLHWTFQFSSYRDILPKFWYCSNCTFKHSGIVWPKLNCIFTCLCRSENQFSIVNCFCFCLYSFSAVCMCKSPSTLQAYFFFQRTLLLTISKIIE